MTELQERFAGAHDDRQAAALRWLRSRSGDDAIAYRTQSARMDAARAEAVARVEQASGHRYVDTNYIFPHYLAHPDSARACAVS